MSDKFKALSDAYENPMSNKETRDRLRAIHRNGGWPQLKEEIIKYNQMREDIIKEMENRTDPVFRRYLKIYKKKLGPKEFDLHRLKVYALCNKQALSRCLSVDEMVNVIHYPVVDILT